jgi:hypothetical protein
VSTQALNWACEHCPYLFGAKRMVFIILAHHENRETLTAWPGIERIALEAGSDRRSVWRALHNMKDDRVIIQARAGGRGQGNRTCWRIVKDKSKWTLGLKTTASGRILAARWREFEKPSRKGKQVRLRVANGEPSRVTDGHPKSPLRVTMTPLKGDNDATNEGSHQLYDPDLSKDGVKVKEIRDPRIGKMLGELSAAMDRRARGGV